MNTSSHKILSHTSIYMIGDILRRCVSLIMLPIYTRYLTPEDYGVVELLTMLLDFAAIIFSARVGQAVFRYYCTSDSEEYRKEIISSALLLSFVMNGTGAIIVIATSSYLANIIFSDTEYKTLISLFAVSMLLTPLIEIPFTHIRAQQKAFLFLIFSIIKLFLQLSLNIYFVVYLELHVLGVIYSAVLSSLAMAGILTLGYSLPRTGMTATIKTCKTLFSFSLPLKLASLGSFYMAFGDRYILNIYTDLTQVGIYALGYKFGFILLLLTWDPFQKLWDSEKYNIYRQTNARSVYRRVFLYTSFILIFVGLCISLFTKDLLIIMADASFLDAHKIVPMIIAAYILQAWTRFCSFGVLVSNKTIHIAHAEIIGVIVITFSYFTLIPLYGIYGAAWSTVLGFAARFYWTDHKARQHYDMELPWLKVIMIASLAIMIFLISLLVSDNILMSIVQRSLLAGLFIISAYYLPIFTREEKNFLRLKARELYRCYFSGDNR